MSNCLNVIYNTIKEYSDIKSQHVFFDWLFPEEYRGKVSEFSDKGKYIRDGLPQKLIRNYIKPSNRNRILEWLNEKCIIFYDNSKTLYEVLLNKLNNEIDKNTMDYLCGQVKLYFNNETQSSFYYVLFCYILSYEIKTGTVNFDVEKTLGELLCDKGTVDISEKLKEFDKDILLTYGVSGKSGSMVIRQLAELGETDNPYIYMEAAELEINKFLYIKREQKYAKKYLKNYTIKYLLYNFRITGKEIESIDDFVNGFTEQHVQIDAASEILQKAYSYYKKASDLGHPLATWSLGYLFYKSAKDGWPKPDGITKDTEQKYIKAVSFFEQAANGKCSKAYNSLGNIVSNTDVNENIKKKLKTAEEYYEQAAKQKNVFGMYNYARELEKKLNNGDEMPIENERHIFMTMLKYFKEAANKGLCKACYRYALYIGHLEDYDTIRKYKTRGLFNQKADHVLAYQYLEKAIQADQTVEYDERCYDAYIYWLRYTILKNMGYGCEKRAKEYLKMLKEEYLNGENIIEEKRAFFNSQKKIVDTVEMKLRERE